MHSVLWNTFKISKLDLHVDLKTWYSKAVCMFEWMFEWMFIEGIFLYPTGPLKPSSHERHKHKQRKQSITSPLGLAKTKQQFFFVSPFVLLLAYAWTMILCLWRSLCRRLDFIPLFCLLFCPYAYAIVWTRLYTSYSLNYALVSHCNSRQLLPLNSSYSHLVTFHKHLNMIEIRPTHHDQP